MSVESLNEADIDVVDGDAENHNYHILGHCFHQGVPVLYHHGYIGRRHVHVSEAEVEKMTVITSIRY